MRVLRAHGAILIAMAICSAASAQDAAVAAAEPASTSDVNLSGGSGTEARSKVRKAGNMSEKASQLVVDVAKRFIEYALASTHDEWDEAFLRYEGPVSSFKVTSIYRQGTRSAFFTSDSDLEVHTAIAELFGELNRELAKTTGKEFVVALLRVNAEYDYHVYFEYQDHNKWYITKLGGQSGIPVIEPASD